MDSEEKHFHFVSTLDEAVKIIDEQGRYWISNCGCREDMGGCDRSRMDVCLFFDTKMGGTGSDFREVDRGFVEGIIEEAEDKHLVPRPFRYEDDKENLQGVCFCCDNCCYYFNDDSAECDKGNSIEYTDLESCTHCGECSDVCYFGARKMMNGELVLSRDDCYGCGLCVDVCPEDSIEMIER